MMNSINGNVENVYNFIDNRILNNKLGIIKDIFTWLPAPDDARVFLAAAISQDMSRVGVKVSTSFNSGAGLTLKQAVYAAVGETIERYCSAFIDKEELIFSSYKELSKHFRCIHPYKFAFYHENQYKDENFMFKKFEPDTWINWGKMISLDSGEDYYIPAPVIYLPYLPESKEDLIWYPVSTGLSCALSLEEAVLKGIYEVIERDAFTIVWYNKLKLPKIDLFSNKEIADLYKKYFEIPGCEYTLVDMTLDTGIPTVLGILNDVRGGILIAAATRLSMKDAILKTLIELSQGRISWKEDFVSGSNLQFKKDFSDIRDFHSRVMLYTKIEMKKHMDFLLKNDEYVEILDDKRETVTEELKITKAKVERLGYRIFYKDMTTEDIRATEYRVARVVIPGFSEITNDHVLPRVGGDRIYTVPVKLGLRKNEITFSTLNNVPHPFP